MGPRDAASADRSKGGAVTPTDFASWRARLGLTKAKAARELGFERVDLRDERAAEMVRQHEAERVRQDLAGARDLVGNGAGSPGAGGSPIGGKP